MREMIRIVPLAGWCGAAVGDAPRPMRSERMGFQSYRKANKARVGKLFAESMEER